MNTIHTYDDREQIKYDFLLKMFPDLKVKTLPSGDYLTARIGYLEHAYDPALRMLPPLVAGPTSHAVLVGHLIENKRQDFNIQDTGSIVQFHKELFQMAAFRKKNPYIQNHAVWFKEGIWDHRIQTKLDGTQVNIIKVFYSMCADYHVRCHVIDDYSDLMRFYRKLEQPSQYKEFEPYLVTHNLEGGFMAHVFVGIRGIDSTNAILLAQLPELQSFGQMFESQLSFEADAAIDGFFGDLKNNEPTAIYLKTKRILETGK